MPHTLPEKGHSGHTYHAAAVVQGNRNERWRHTLVSEFTQRNQKDALTVPKREKHIRHSGEGEGGFLPQTRNLSSHNFQKKVLTTRCMQNLGA